MRDLRTWAPECEVSDLHEGSKWLEFVIEKLLEDREHTLLSEVVYSLTFEELLGALAAGCAAFARLDSYENADATEGGLI